MTIRIAINGFGRTGRSMLRSALTFHPELEIVAINDLGAPRRSLGCSHETPYTVGSRSP